MDLKLIRIGKWEATRQHKLYCSLRQDLPDVAVMKSAYYHMCKGRAVLDLYAAMHAAGTNSLAEPRLAIARAGAKLVSCCRSWGAGSARFSWGRSRHDQFDLPNGTFPGWDRLNLQTLQTKVPTIPAPVLQTIRGPVTRFHILWEVENWDILPQDPILLLELSQNLFAVMAKWDLTPLEQAIMNGRS